MKNYKIKDFSYLMIICLLMCGCAFKASPSGFLDDYSMLRKSEERKDLFVYNDISEDSQEYTKLMIDSVIVYFHPDAKGIGIDPEKLQELSIYLEARLSKKFEENFTITDKPGPGVLQLKTAITDIVSNKPLLNIAPHHTLASGIGLGGAAMEAEFIDSISKKRILAIRYSRKGKRRRYLKGLTKWGHTEDVLNEWADILFDELIQPQQ